MESTTKVMKVEFDMEVYKHFRRLLFGNGLNMQEFISYLVVKGHNQDKRVMELFKEAGAEKGKKGYNLDSFSQKTTSEEIYNMLEQRSVYNKKQRRDDDNESNEYGDESEDKSESWLGGSY
jgi:hypothetical protein